MKRSRKKIFLPKFKFLFDKDSETLSSTTILVKGNLLTCIILSIASGFIDLAFFSGLSKSLLHMGTIPMSAAILYTMISIGFISAKFWCAMKLGMVKELETRLQAKGFVWAKNLKKAQIPWHIAHKFLIAISIITALSLSVNSIGSAMKNAERNSTNITVSIDELKALKDQKKSDSSEKRSLTRGNLEGIATSKQTAEEEASRYWPDIQKWQERVKEIDEDTTLTNDEKDALKSKERTVYVRRAPGFVSNKNIDYISKIDLVNAFQKEAKKSEVDRESLEAYNKLTDENNEEIRNTILALENLYRHPNEYKNGLVIEGQPVSFLDEDGQPLDITQVIGILQGLREEWKSNTDIGESSQIFMLISELITSKRGEGSSSGSGVAETIMMIFIALAGIVQEFLIAIFTPKAAIDRKLLRQVSQYLEWSSIEEKERFLIEVYIEYEGDGVINQVQFENKVQKSVKIMEQTIDGIINKYTCVKSDKEQKLLDKLDIAEEKLNESVTENKELKNQLIVLKNQLDTAHSEVEKVHEKQEKRRIVKQEEFSSQVDDVVKEIEGLI